MEFAYDVVCLSHLRWAFVFQRPQHLLSRCARERRVFFVEEPIYIDGPNRLDIQLSPEGVSVVTPHITVGEPAPEQVQTGMLRALFGAQQIVSYVLWYYTPMALLFTAELKPLAVIYDCMDQLAAFKNAPANIVPLERELLSRADVVFTGGRALFEEKQGEHSNIHAFPSSVDFAHFASARSEQPDPEDQRAIARPRLGFFGVVDERMNLELLAGVAAARPNWQIVILGPVVKIDEAELPRPPNVHYLGSKTYAELPAYIAGWDVALLPFAQNESTRFISPTKTPEYLAAGKPVVSTSIRDVVRPYQELGLVHIADTVAEFVAGCEAAVQELPSERLRKADAFLSQQSWDGTWGEMRLLIDAAVQKNRARLPASDLINATISAGAEGI